LNKEKSEINTRVALQGSENEQLRHNLDMLVQDMDEADRKIQDDEFTKDSLVKTIKVREEEVRNSAIGFSNRETELANMIHELNTKGELSEKQLKEVENAKIMLIEENQK